MISMLVTSSSQEICKYSMLATIFYLLGRPTITSILRRISVVRPSSLVIDLDHKEFFKFIIMIIKT